MSESAAHNSIAPLPPREALGAEIMARLDRLSVHSETEVGLTRRFATPQHRAAADLILDWMRNAGMSAEMDAVGNVVGRYEGTEPGLPAIMMGSHQDSVRQGGRYDGMLGIVAPISCVKALNEAGVRLPFAIEVVAFGDEEGLRFQTTLLGSRALSGTFDPAVLSRRDDDGITLEQAMRDFGLDPDAVPGLARNRRDLLAYVETHIEQGPVLEAEGRPVGIVTAIAGGARLTVTFNGTAGHAGTVPMARRHDALTAAAEAVLAVESRCRGIDGLVGTVGRIEALPGAVNVIPGEARFTIDLRAADPEVREAAIEDVTVAFREIAVRRGVTVDVERSYKAKGCACTPRIMDGIETAVVAEGITPLRLFSGAGHDAMAMVDITDIGMLFVRCKDGISHNPAESITPEDAGTAARVLLRFLAAYDPAQQATA
jgi:allantoate deiminase